MTTHYYEKAIIFEGDGFFHGIAIVVFVGPMDVGSEGNRLAVGGDFFFSGGFAICKKVIALGDVQFFILAHDTISTCLLNAWAWE